MRVLVIPMSSGEFDVQMEAGDVGVSNTQVPPPEEMLRAFPDTDARRVVQESVSFLLERDRSASLSGFLSLDALWRSDADFARGVAARLG
jgi:hypothetical protein